MKVHLLKTWKEPFRAVWDGLKTAEFRKNDRDFQVGDAVILAEWDIKTSQFTGDIILIRSITDIRKESAFGIPEGYCMFSWWAKRAVKMGRHELSTLIPVLKSLEKLGE